MHSVGWHGAKPGSEIPLDVLLPPKAPQWPDYQALISILQDLRQPLDPESGETVLTSEEAARISACGLEARAGLWRCPLLRDNLVWWIPVLCMLSDLYGPETRGDRWHAKRAAVRQVVRPMDPLGKFDRRLIRRLLGAPGHCLTRSALKRTYWRRGASSVDFTIDRLLAMDYINEHGGLLYPFSKTEFKAWQEEQKRPRRPIPVQHFQEQHQELSSKRAMYESGKGGHKCKLRIQILAHKH